MSEKVKAPTEAQIKEWNTKYPLVNKSVIQGISFYYRPLFRSEYKKISVSEEEMLDREDELCSICVLWPENLDYDNMIAGVATILTEEIMKVSGFDPDIVTESVSLQEM